MRLTTKGRFAVTAMIDLALREHSGPVALAAISARQQISLSYLEQLFGKLRRHELVESTRGPGGGYSLGRKADWSGFAAAYVPGTYEDDVEIACGARLAARQREGDAALAPARSLWLTGQATPDACEPVFVALIQRGTITTEDRWARYRLALDGDHLPSPLHHRGDT